jgi:hypothetical protein
MAEANAYGDMLVDVANLDKTYLTVEQVRSARNTWLTAADLKPAKRKERYEEELKKQRYYQRRSQQSRKSHTEMRLAQLNALGIDANKIKSCVACGLHGDLQRFVHPTYINERSQSGAAQLATVLRCARWQAILLYCL